MRPLMCEQSECDVLENIETSNCFEVNLEKLKNLHHSQCLFNRERPAVPGLEFSFDSEGNLHGTFNCNDRYQGYDRMVHGGVIAAVIDASMAQCLMGHGVVGYTADLSIRYRKPVVIETETKLVTSITEVNVGRLYSMKCELFQNRMVVVKATGKFIKIK